MGFWNKLGKIALQAAPYVAAPFTGGASLLATGGTQYLGQKWAEADAKKAIAKGLAPSKFDKYLGLASAGAGLASSFAPVSSALTGLSSAGKAANAAKAAKAASTVGKVAGWSDKLGKIVKVGNAAASGAGLVGGAIQVAREGSDPGISSDELSVTGYGSPSSGSSSPSGGEAQPRGVSNFASALAAGRNTALRNQPFRKGYDVVSPGINEGDPEIRTPMPPIYPQYREDIRTEPNSFPEPSGFQRNLAGVQARRRNPEVRQ